MRAGDKCPRCREGLVLRTETGFSCDNCSWEQDIEEVMAQQMKVTRGGFRPAKVSIRIEDPEEGEQFLRGLIVARSNNSSPFFEELIEGVNAVLEPWREERLAKELAQR